jgi:hypothetical protein
MGLRLLSGGCTILAKFRPICMFGLPPNSISTFHMKQADITSVTFKYPSLDTVNLDELNGSSRSVGELAVADSRGKSSIRATRDISPIPTPSIVQVCVCLLGTVGMVGRPCDGCISGGTFCLRFFFLPFNSIDIGLAVDSYIPFTAPLCGSVNLLAQLGRCNLW